MCAVQARGESSAAHAGRARGSSAQKARRECRMAVQRIRVLVSEAGRGKTPPGTFGACACGVLCDECLVRDARAMSSCDATRGRRAPRFKRFTSPRDGECHGNLFVIESARCPFYAAASHESDGDGHRSSAAVWQRDERAVLWRQRQAKTSAMRFTEASGVTGYLRAPTLARTGAETVLE